MEGRNQVLITIDSLRWDTFERADAPFLKSFNFHRCWSHGTFTFAAHQAFFSGRMPCSFDGEEYFDTCAHYHRRKIVRQQIWRLANPESPKPGMIVVQGRNLKDGLRQKGYVTIGTGAMNWFDPSKEASEPMRSDFDHFRFFPNREVGDGRNIDLQIEWALEQVKQARHDKRPYFLFINVGETHQPYTCKGHSLRGDWGDVAGCAAAQRASLEYVDAKLAGLLAQLENYFAVICGDHGDCWGEDGLWGHGFYHPKVLEVPMVIADDSIAGRMKRLLTSFWPGRNAA